MKLSSALLASVVHTASADGKAKLVINEVSDAGTSNACDSSDWIELLNIPAGDDLLASSLNVDDDDCGDDLLGAGLSDDDSCTIDLSGYKLCDDKGCADEDAYTFPSGSQIKPGEHKVICRGDAGFAFGIGGDDTVTLQDKNGNVLDTAGPLLNEGGVDITWSRIPDGTGSFQYTAQATPGAPNVAKDLPQYADCGSAYSSLSTGDVCTVSWTSLTTGEHRLLPTESSVGHAWVIRQMYDDFETEADATDWLSKKEFPVVLHNGNFYLTDRHHHAVALQLSGHADKMTLLVKVVCDFTDVPAANFWSEMVANNYALAYDWSDDAPEALPGLVDFSKMPTSWDIGAYGDNQWRALAGFASSDKWDGWTEEERCYVQECEYFVDFGWAYLFTEAAIGENDKWPSDAATSPSQFLTRLRALPRKLTVQDYDPAAWHALAGELLPLCHSPAVKDHPLPEFFPSGALKGWSTVPLPADPDCAPHQCGAAALVV
jgi:hypothetical protein